MSMTRRTLIRALIQTAALLGALAVLAPAASAQPAPPGAPRGPVMYENPVIPGDFPDPSIIRVGSRYVATMTSPSYAPIFPMFESRDLVNWQQVGAILRRPPGWASGRFWAPEITPFGGRYFVYYSARSKATGRQCIGAASAPRPLGPYTDAGRPVACGPGYFLDPYMVEDEDGQPHLVWKDGAGVPGPIVAQPLGGDGLSLIGERKSLIAAGQSWEGVLIEGPAIVRRGDYFYMFYSGDNCCTRRCHYAKGVARARELLGPWEKFAGNPILANNPAFVCPGHGTLVGDHLGRDQLLYHAFQSRDFVAVGRQTLLDEVVYGDQGWPVINNGLGPSRRAASPFGRPGPRDAHRFLDEFAFPRLHPSWQWPATLVPFTQLRPARGGRLLLGPPPRDAGDMLGGQITRPTTVGNYMAKTAVRPGSLRRGAAATLTVLLNRFNAVGVAVSNGKIFAWRRQANAQQTLQDFDLPPSPVVHLRLFAMGNYRFRFEASADDRRWKQVGPDAVFFPPTDRELRVGLAAGQRPASSALFEYFYVNRFVAPPPRPRPPPRRPGASPGPGETPAPPQPGGRARPSSRR